MNPNGNCPLRETMINDLIVTYFEKRSNEIRQLGFSLSSQQITNLLLWEWAKSTDEEKLIALDANAIPTEPQSVVTSSSRSSNSTNNRLVSSQVSAVRDDSALNQRNNMLITNTSPTSQSQTLHVSDPMKLTWVKSKSSKVPRHSIACLICTLNGVCNIISYSKSNKDNQYKVIEQSANELIIIKDPDEVKRILGSDHDSVCQEMQKILQSESLDHINNATNDNRENNNNYGVHLHIQDMFDAAASHRPLTRGAKTDKSSVASLSLKDASEDNSQSNGCSEWVLITGIEAYDNCLARIVDTNVPSTPSDRVLVNCFIVDDENEYQQKLLSVPRRNVKAATRKLAERRLGRLFRKAAASKPSFDKIITIGDIILNDERTSQTPMKKLKRSADQEISEQYWSHDVITSTSSSDASSLFAIKTRKATTTKSTEKPSRHHISNEKPFYSYGDDSRSNQERPKDAFQVGDFAIISSSVGTYFNRIARVVSRKQIDYVDYCMLQVIQSALPKEGRIVISVVRHQSKSTNLAKVSLIEISRVLGVQLTQRTLSQLNDILRLNTSLQKLVLFREKGCFRVLEMKPRIKSPSKRRRSTNTRSRSNANLSSTNKISESIVDTDSDELSPPRPLKRLRRVSNTSVAHEVPRDELESPAIDCRSVYSSVSDGAGLTEGDGFEFPIDLAIVDRMSESFSNYETFEDRIIKEMTDNTPSYEELKTDCKEEIPHRQNNLKIIPPSTDDLILSDIVVDDYVDRPHCSDVDHLVSIEDDRIQINSETNRLSYRSPRSCSDRDSSDSLSPPTHSSDDENKFKTSDSMRVCKDCHEVVSKSNYHLHQLDYHMKSVEIALPRHPWNRYVRNSDGTMRCHHCSNSFATTQVLKSHLYDCFEYLNYVSDKQYQ